jgi:hypothetical protein
VVSVVDAVRQLRNLQRRSSPIKINQIVSSHNLDQRLRSVELVGPKGLLRQVTKTVLTVIRTVRTRIRCAQSEGQAAERSATGRRRRLALETAAGV